MAAVYGLYESSAHTEYALEQITGAGFSLNDISVILHHSKDSNKFAYDRNTKAPEWTIAGATTSVAVGGTLGLLASIGVPAIPGSGPFMAVGPIIGTFGGLGVGGAVDGLIGAFVGMGIPETEAERYEDLIKDGSIWLSVSCNSAQELIGAKDLLKRTGAKDISTVEEAVSPHCEQIVTVPIAG